MCRLGSALESLWRSMGAAHFGDLVRFTADVFRRLPSIVVGIVAYPGIVVLEAGTFLGAGGRSGAGYHDDSDDYAAPRQRCCCWFLACRCGRAAYGLGSFTLAGVAFSIALRLATSGVMAGVMLAFCKGCRRDGAAAVYGLRKSVLELGGDDSADGGIVLQVYTYAISPFDEWHRQA